MRIRLGTNLEELVTLRPDRTPPTWDPVYFPSGEAFWLHGTEGGETVFVVAARLFDVADLAKEVAGLKFFYRDRQNMPDSVEVSGFDGLSITGLAVHTGNLWVSPKFRGLGRAALATKLLHLFSLIRWPDAKWIFGFVEKELIFKGLYLDQGYPRAQGSITWRHNPYRRTYRMMVVSATKPEILSGLGRSHGTSAFLA